ncbi:decarboxylase [Desulfococcus sp.]|uniref:diaminopimelate decarboxylase family protein n=1 Tax=Desulfococcus sp. TaxID=2025834 RepID=UPI0035930502
MTQTAQGPISPAEIEAAVGRPLPPFPEASLRAFVARHFDRAPFYMDALRNHPPPVYLLETQVLAAGARRFMAAFQGALPDTAFYYAMKSNNHPEVAGHLLKQGFGLDVSGGPELAAALDLGALDIIFSGPGKTDAELDMAVRHAEKVVVLMDSFGELGRLEKAAASRGAVVRTGVRLTTNPDGLWRKFGIPPDRIEDFFQAARSCPHVRLQGLQFHTSWNLSPEAQLRFIEMLGGVLRTLPEGFLREFAFIDIGGGYWPEQGEWLHPGGTPEGMIRKALGQTVAAAAPRYRIPSMPIEGFSEALVPSIERHLRSVVPCRICFEPGRWLVNDAMHIIVSVVDKKASDLVITDAGTNAVGWERYETDYFPVLNLTRPAMIEHPCHILGALCTPHDVWGYAYWGEAIEPGDILLIPTQGAYTYSLRQEFIKPLPAVVVVV